MPIVRWFDRDDDGFWVVALGCGHTINLPRISSELEEGDSMPCHKCDRDRSR